MKKGSHHSVAIRKRISDAQKGKKNSMFGKRGENSPRFGKHHSLATRKKMSDALKGKNHPLFGKHRSLVTRKKISDANKGKSFSEAHRKKLSDAEKGERNHFFGKHLSIAHRKKISDALKDKYVGENHPMFGKHPSEATRKKQSDAMTGHFVSMITRKKMSDARKGKYCGESNHNFGKHLSEATRKKLSDAHKGEKHHNWIDGRSFLPYTHRFNKRFKNEMRTRDGFQCWFPNCSNKQRLNAHHIDYDKTHADPLRCIILCNLHNTKVNNDRVFWQNHFVEVMILRKESNWAIPKEEATKIVLTNCDNPQNHSGVR